MGLSEAEILAIADAPFDPFDPPGGTVVHRGPDPALTVRLPAHLGLWITEHAQAAGVTTEALTAGLLGEAIIARLAAAADQQQP